MMLRVIPLLSLLFLTSTGQASSASARYLVDIIVFAHTYAPIDQLENTPEATLTRDPNFAIPLRAINSSATGGYQLLPSSYSSLNDAWSRLYQQSQYRPLFHYTWIQPSNNQQPVSIVTETNHGWNVEGTLRVRQSNYYLLDTELRFNTPNNRQSSFIFSQKQRIKPGNIYYLDHPQVGMLIYVHKVA
jgi:hypothetical protein